MDVDGKQPRKNEQRNAYEREQNEIAPACGGCIEHVSSGALDAHGLDVGSQRLVDERPFARPMKLQFLSAVEQGAEIPNQNVFACPRAARKRHWEGKGWSIGG